MWIAPVIPLLALVAAAPAEPAAAQAARQSLTQPLVTRNSSFTIPFQVGTAASPSLALVEVHLLVSRDRGATWQLYTKAPPTQGHFLFRTSGDGEFLFGVRTLDRSGQLHPRGAPAPGLCVIVDTTPPVMNLKAWRGEAGQVSAQWDISELHLRPETFTLVFRSDPSQAWQSVAVDPNNQRLSGTTMSGAVTWWPHVNSGTIQLRAEVTDAAGNTSVNQAQVAMNPPPPAAPQIAQTPPAPISQQPPASPPASPPANPPQPATTNRPVEVPRTQPVVPPQPPAIPPESRLPAPLTAPPPAPQQAAQPLPSPPVSVPPPAASGFMFPPWPPTGVGGRVAAPPDGFLPNPVREPVEQTTTRPAPPETEPTAAGAPANRPAGVPASPRPAAEDAVEVEIRSP